MRYAFWVCLTLMISIMKISQSSNIYPCIKKGLKPYYKQIYHNVIPDFFFWLQNFFHRCVPCSLSMSDISVTCKKIGTAIRQWLFHYWITELQVRREWTMHPSSIICSLHLLSSSYIHHNYHQLPATFRNRFGLPLPTSLCRQLPLSTLQICRRITATFDSTGNTKSFPHLNFLCALRLGLVLLLVYFTMFSIQ